MPVPVPVTEGEVGEDEEPLLPSLRVRSNMRSFRSAPPVARTWGVGWMGNATARTMWECWRVWRHSPVWVSQTLLRVFNWCQPKQTPNSQFAFTCTCTYAEKSAAAVAAMVASVDSLACHTAPLWPRKVPILMIPGISKIFQSHQNQSGWTRRTNRR